MRFVQDFLVATLLFAAVLLILFWEVIFTPGRMWQSLLVLGIASVVMGTVTALFQPQEHLARNHPQADLIERCRAPRLPSPYAAGQSHMT